MADVNAEHLQMLESLRALLFFEENESLVHSADLVSQVKITRLTRELAGLQSIEIARALKVLGGSPMLNKMLKKHLVQNGVRCRPVVLIVPPCGWADCRVTNARLGKAAELVVAKEIPNPDFMPFPQGEGLGVEISNHVKIQFPEFDGAEHLFSSDDGTWGSWEDLARSVKLAEQAAGKGVELEFHIVTEAPHLLRHKIAWWAIGAHHGVHFHAAPNLRPWKDRLVYEPAASLKYLWLALCHRFL